MKRVFVLSLTLGLLSLFWVMPFCYWLHVGWCADFTPVAFFAMIPPVWFVAGFVVFLVAWHLDKRERHLAARFTRWATFLSLFVSAAYFQAVESLRKCVISAAGTGDAAKLTRCLNLGASAQSLEYRDGPPALWVAISKHQLNAVEILLGRGPSLSKSDPCDPHAPLEALRVFSSQPVDEVIRERLLTAGARECPRD
jgi:hypothetical protein